MYHRTRCCTCASPVSSGRLGSSLKSHEDYLGSRSSNGQSSLSHSVRSTLHSVHHSSTCALSSSVSLESADRTAGVMLFGLQVYALSRRAVWSSNPRMSYPSTDSAEVHLHMLCIRSRGTLAIESEVAKNFRKEWNEYLCVRVGGMTAAM